MDSRQVEQIHDLIKEFYTVIRIRISIFDSNFDLITEYPDEPPLFCAAIRKSEEGRKACRTCDLNAFQIAAKSSKPYKYICHAGLTEVITPIKLGEGVRGYAILAHILNKDNKDDQIKEAVKRAKKYRVDEANALNFLSKIHSFREEQLNGSVKLLEAIASYLSINNIVHNDTTSLSVKINNYIFEHISGDLSTAILCKQFAVSRSTLHRLSIAEFGMPISAYISHTRIGVAKNLLTGQFKVQEVAYECGIPDYEYFYKVFKKETGMSPTQYKNLKSK